VEIQFTDQFNMPKRSIYYWSGIYRKQLRTGMGYTELNSVISINLMHFNIFKQTERFHTTYHLFEDKEKFKLTNVMEFHFIEMPKLLKAWKEERLDPWNDVLARWLLLLGMVDRRKNKFYEDIYHELEEIAMEDKTLREAFHDWEELSMTPDQFLAYEARLKHIMDEEAAKRETELRVQKAEKRVREAKKKAAREREKAVKEREKAVKERKEAVRERKKAVKETKELIAQRLLENHTEIPYIMELTDLTKEEVLEIQRNMRK